MSLCETCKHLVKDFEIGVALKPEDTPNEFRTWMICALNVKGFPFKKECEKYEANTGPRYGR